MPLNRRQVVKAGATLSGVALVSTKAEGQFQLQEGQQNFAQPGEASGKVTLYGEGSTTYFALSEMPKGVETFYIDPRYSDRLGRLVLAAGEKGWEIRVTFTSNVNGAGPVYDVRVENFRAG